MVVNQHPTLRYSTGNPQVGKGTRLEQTEDRVKKNQREKAKRDGERYHLERISHLFKVAGPRQTWTRVDVLSFGKMVLPLTNSAGYSPNISSHRVSPVWLRRVHTRFRPGSPHRARAVK